LHLEDDGKQTRKLTTRLFSSTGNRTKQVHQYHNKQDQTLSTNISPTNNGTHPVSLAHPGGSHSEAVTIMIIQKVFIGSKQRVNN